jgi:hypothetical protein
MYDLCFEDIWANKQLLKFNTDPIFKEAILSLEKKKIEEFYFLTEEKPTEEDFDNWHNLWKDLWKITKKYVEKKKNELFEYEFAYEFYFHHLAANLVVYYLLEKVPIEGSLKDHIKKKIIEDGYFLGPGAGDAYMSWRRAAIIGEGIITLNTICSTYLALKWFYRDKTKKYYSPEIQQEIKDYEMRLKNPLDAHWRDKIEERRKQWKYKLRV